MRTGSGEQVKMTEEVVWRVELREVIPPWDFSPSDSGLQKVYGEGRSTEEALADLRSKLRENLVESRSRLALLEHEYGEDKT
jgi:hypothetical protein